MNIVVFICLFLFCAATYAEKNFRLPEVIKFADDFSQKSQYEKSEILRALNSANYRQMVIDNISKPAEKILSWGQYRSIFLDRDRMENGKILSRICQASSHCVLFLAG